MFISHTLRIPMGAMAAALVAFCPVVTATASAAPSVVHMAPSTAVGTRSLDIAAAPNARDIGGYPAEHGAKIRYGLVYRSDALAGLTAADEQKLVSLNVGRVIDFRSPNEVASAADKVPPSITYQQLPIWNSSNDFYVEVSKILHGGPTVQQQELGNGRGDRLMRDYYQWLVTDSGTRSELSTALKEIASDPKAVLYHCTAGKDRTGWLTAILMTVLGVPKGQIDKDYLASNQYLAATNQAEIAALEKAGLVTDPSLLTPILGVQQDFLDAAFDQVQRSYGSFDRFVVQGLGVDQGTVAALKTKLLDG